MSHSDFRPRLSNEDGDSTPTQEDVSTFTPVTVIEKNGDELDPEELAEAVSEALEHLKLQVEMSEKEEEEAEATASVMNEDFKQQNSKASIELACATIEAATAGLQEMLTTNEGFIPTTRDAHEIGRHALHALGALKTEHGFNMFYRPRETNVARLAVANARVTAHVTLHIVALTDGYAKLIIREAGKDLFIAFAEKQDQYQIPRVIEQPEMKQTDSKETIGEKDEVGEESSSKGDAVEAENTDFLKFVRVCDETVKCCGIVHKLIIEAAKSRGS